MHRLCFGDFFQTSLKNTCRRLLGLLGENELNHTEHFNEIRTGFCSTALRGFYCVVLPDHLL